MGSLTKHNVQSLVDRHCLVNYVETGTGSGECLEYAMRFSFEKLYSVEIYEPIYEAAKSKFNSLSRIYGRECEILHGHSTEQLAHILDDIDDDATLFFLDAHFPGADFKYETYDAEADEAVRVPLRGELEVIVGARDVSGDVFIIDDLWLYEEGEYESGTLQAHLNKHFPDMEYTKNSLSGTQTSRFIYDLFSNTHDIIKDMRDQGYLILVPKEASGEIK